jgi:hypothetical protein
MNEVNQPDGPLYALAHREAVDARAREVVVTDPRFLLTTTKVTESDGTQRDEPALLLFTRREFAQRCRAKLQQRDTVVATFRGSDHLGDCLRDFLSGGCKTVILNRGSGVGRESIIAIQEVLDAMG